MPLPYSREIYSHVKKNAPKERARRSGDNKVD